MFTGTAPAGVEEDDNRRTMSGDQLAAAAKLHTRSGTTGGDRSTTGHSVYRTSVARDCSQLLFT